MRTTDAPRSVRFLVVGTAVLASALGAACGSPLGPREAGQLPVARAALSGAGGDSVGGVRAAGGSIPWYRTPPTGGHEATNMTAGGGTPWYSGPVSGDSTFVTTD